MFVTFQSIQLTASNGWVVEHQNVAGNFGLNYDFNYKKMTLFWDNIDSSLQFNKIKE
jgi:hypothetical protein